MQQLAEAVYSKAWSRLLSCRLSIAAGHATRKIPRAVREEIALFEEKRDAIVKLYAGKVNQEGTGYHWPEDQAASAEAAMGELLAQKVTLPGPMVKMADILDGGLRQTDYDLLEPWVVW